MKKLLVCLLGFIFLLASCSDETTIFQEPLNDSLVLETNQTTLENNVKFKNALLVDILIEDKQTGKYSKRAELSGKYPLNLIAQITSPVGEDGEKLTATHVAVEGDFVYASYNSVGEKYSGAIDIIRIDELRTPVLTGRLFLETADINSLVYDDGYIYAVGGFDSEKDVTVDVNSFIAKIPVNNGVFDAENIIYAHQEGFNATDVKVNGDNVIVTSGGMGVVASYNKFSMEMVNTASYDDLRSIAVNNNNIAVLNASSGIKVLSQNFDVLNEFNVSLDFGDFAKRTIDFSNDNLVVSGGSDGAALYNVNTGSLLQTLPIPIRPENVETVNIVTNSIAANEDLLLMANGGAGLSLSEEINGTVESVGIIDIEGSINYVASKGDYIFAASGREGVQIIKINRPSEDLVAACSALSLDNGDAQNNVTVLQDENKAYRVSKYFNDVENNGQLLLCGWFVSNNNLLINDGSLMETNGRFWVRQDLTIESGAKLRATGDFMVIYGDIILNDGATLEFVDTNMAVYVLGSGIRNGNTEVTGNFPNIFNNL